MTAATKPFPVSLADIEAAASTIAGAVEATPARYSHTLSAIAGAEIFVKFENLQFTASFKERGALNKLRAITRRAWPITLAGSRFPRPSSCPKARPSRR